MRQTYIQRDRERHVYRQRARDTKRERERVDRQTKLTDRQKKTDKPNLTR